jgi:hypothetical protein
MEEFEVSGQNELHPSPSHPHRNGEFGKAVSPEGCPGPICDEKSGLLTAD